MVTLYWMFFKQITRLVWMVAIGCLVTVLVFDRIDGGSTSKTAVLLPSVGFILSLIVCLVHVNKNLSWIRGLPLKKRDILLLNFVLNVSGAVMGWVSVICMLVIHHWIKNGLPSIAEIESRFQIVLTSLNGGWKAPTFLVWLVLFGSLSIYFGIYIALKPASQALVQTSAVMRTPGISKKSYFARCAVVLFLLPVSFKAFEELSFGLPYVIALIAGFPLFLLVMSANSLGVSRPVRRNWYAVATAVAAMQIGFLYSQAKIAIQASDPKELAEALRFLGPLSGTVPEASLARALERPQDEDDRALLISHYRSQFKGDRTLASSVPAGVSLERLLQQQTSSRGIANVMTMYDSSMLSVGQLRAVLNRYAEFNSVREMEHRMYSFLQAKLDDQELTSLLVSGTPVERHYALLRSRYDRRPAVIETIALGLQSYSIEQQLDALMTLGVLSGRKLSLQDYAPIAERRSRPEFFSTSCGEYRPSFTLLISSTDVPRLNVCLREAALKEMNPKGSRKLASIESVGWIAPPFSASQKRVIREVYNLK